MKNLFYLLLALLFFSCGKSDTNNQTIVPTKRDEKMVENKNPAITKSEEVKVKKTAADFKYDPNNELPESIFTKTPTLTNPYYSTAPVILNASLQVLKKNQLQNLNKEELELLRNSIYARHGYIFKSYNIKYIFDKVDWYYPVYEDVSNEITDLELKNIDLIKRFEAHAKKFVYGR